MTRTSKATITAAQADAKLYNKLGIDENYLRQNRFTPEGVRDKFFTKEGREYRLKTPQQLLGGIEDRRAQHEILDAVERYIGEQGKYVQRLQGTKLEAAYVLQSIIERYRKTDKTVADRRELEKRLVALAAALRPKKHEEKLLWGRGLFGKKTRDLGDVVEEGLGKAAALIFLAGAISYLGKASTGLTGAVIGAQPAAIGMLFAAAVAIASFYIILK